MRSIHSLAWPQSSWCAGGSFGQPTWGASWGHSQAGPKDPSEPTRSLFTSLLSLGKQFCKISGSKTSLTQNSPWTHGFPNSLQAGFDSHSQYNVYSTLALRWIWRTLWAHEFFEGDAFLDLSEQWQKSKGLFPPALTTRVMFELVYSTSESCVFGIWWCPLNAQICLKMERLDFQMIFWEKGNNLTIQFIFQMTSMELILDTEDSDCLSILFIQTKWMWRIFHFSSPIDFCRLKMN